MPATGPSESYVQLVFSSLLNMKDEGVVVGRNVQLVDKFGLAHRVDIFYPKAPDVKSIRQQTMWSR